MLYFTLIGNKFSEKKKRDEKLKAKERRKKNLNNARARKSRLKKKKFYEELENKISELENELAQKNILIEEFKNSLLQKEKNSNLGIQEENKEQPENILQNLSTSKEFRDKEREIADLYTPFGQERIKLINSAFTTIIQNLHPDEFKILFKHSDLISHKRVKRTEKDKEGKLLLDLSSLRIYLLFLK